MEYAVIGLGRFGYSVAKELQAHGNNVIAIDIDEGKCRAIEGEVEDVLILDGTDEKALRQASIDHIETVIVGMGESSMTESLLTCLSLQNIGIKKIIAKATSDSHAKILEKIEVEKIVRPEADMGKRLASKLSNSMVLDYIDIADGIRMETIEANDYCKFLHNRSIYEINLRKNYGINIICIKRDRDLIIPERDTIIKKNDLLMLVGENEKIDRFEKKMKIR